MRYAVLDIDPAFGHRRRGWLSILKHEHKKVKYKANDSLMIVREPTNLNSISMLVNIIAADMSCR